MSMNNNVEKNNQVQCVGENSFMHKCYLGSLAKVTGYDVIEFLQGFIKGLKGDVGMIYSQDPETKEIQGMLAIPYKINSQGQQQTNTSGLIPIPGINNPRKGNINENILKSIDRIKLQGYAPTILAREDAILFRIDFAALMAEMMNPAKGYAVSIDDIRLNGQSDILAIVSVFKSKNSNNVNRMTKILQGQKFNNRPSQSQPQRYNNGQRR